MSLINQMLRDLETRHSKGAETDMDGDDSGGLKRSPGPARDGGTPWKRRLALGVSAIALLACGSGAGWYLAHHTTPQRITQISTTQAGSGAASAEHIRVASPPAAALQEDPPTAKNPESPAPADSSSVLPAAPAQTAAAIQTAEEKMENKTDSPSPSNSGKGVAQQGEQRSSPSENATPPPPVPPARRVAISPASTALEQRRLVLNEARQHSRKGDYPGAVAILRQHLLQNPHPQPGTDAAPAEIISLDARIHRRLALAQLRLGRTAAAADTLEQGHLRAPDDVELHMLYARVLLEQNNPERAYNMLRHMAQPGIAAHPDFYALRAALAREHGAYAEAAELYTLLCQLDPRRGDWRLGLAISQHQQGHLDKAYQNYQHAAATTALDASLRKYASRQAQQLFSHE